MIARIERSTNRALAGAERKGREAFRNGEPRTACPYPDYRKWDGRLTFSRAFCNAWRDGWDDEKRYQDGGGRSACGTHKE